MQGGSFTHNIIRDPSQQCIELSCWLLVLFEHLPVEGVLTSCWSIGLCHSWLFVSCRGFALPFSIVRGAVLVRPGLYKFDIFMMVAFGGERDHLPWALLFFSGSCSSHSPGTARLTSIWG